MENSNFIHLRNQSSYSLSESALKIDKLIELTKKFEMPAVALTDNNNMFGALEFSIKSMENGIQPIIGTTINLKNFKINSNRNFFGFQQITCIAMNKIGYNNLLILSSKSHIESKNNIPGLDIDEIINHKEGIFVFLGGIYNPILHFFNSNKFEDCKSLIQKLKNEFNENLAFELQRINEVILDKFENQYINLALDFDIPLIASNNVQFPTSNYFNAHDSLICISEKTKVTSDNRKKSNPNIFFKSSQEMIDLFKDIPESINNTYLLSLKCDYAPKKRNPKLPKFITDNKISEEKELNIKSNLGLETRFKKLKYKNKFQIYNKRLVYELEVINKMGFAGYFLIVADFIKWAKDNNIPVGPGRGSGAGSLVAWSLMITDLDPIKYGLIFERFLNPERISLPDFDIDFCQERRDEVIGYVEKKYGRNSVAHIITFGTLASRAVIRDLGRVHDIPYNEVDQFTKLIPYNPANPITLAKSIEIEPNLNKEIQKDDRLSIVINEGLKLEGLYRHASTHAAGVVISNENLQSIIPLYKDIKTQKINTQFSMDYVQLAGLIKFDFLGLTTLTILDKTIKLIRKTNSNFSLEDIPINDLKTFNNLSQGKTTGVFQLESNGMKDVLKRLKPDRFEEIIAVVALFRPGPMENISSFCNRKHNLEKIDYLHPMLEPALKETYGIIVYQEQVLQIAQILSGYSLGEADLLRKAMGKKISREMKAQKNKFIEGALKKGLNDHEASLIFDLVYKFAGYGFNKCHAAGYALIAYQTAYLKTHFSVEFLVSSLNLSINKTENIVMFKKEIDDLNINLMPPNINISNSEFSIEIDELGKKIIRFGLSAIKGVGFSAMVKLVKERELNGKFIDIIDFISRLDTDVINKRQLEKLIISGALDTLNDNRAFLFENVIKLIDISNSIRNNTNQSSLFNDKDMKFDYNKNLIKIPYWSLSTKLKNELNVIGFYFSDHPLALFSEKILKLIGVSKYNEIINDSSCLKSNIAGSVLDIKERTSKDGNKYAIITISEINNQYELTIFGDIYRNNLNFLKEGSLLILEIDLILQHDKNRRFVVRKVDLLENKIKMISFDHILTISNITDINLINDFFIEKTPNQNKIFIKIRRDDSNISISLPKNLTFKNEHDFNKALKINNILREVKFTN